MRNREFIMKSIVGGLLGTVMMTLMMRFVAPLMLGHPMDIAAMLGTMMGGSWMLGMIAHLMNGVVIFPMIYALVVYNLLPGPPVMRGIAWGGLLWLAAETVIMPMAGAGFFSSQAGGAMAVVAALMGHVVYGAMLGLVSGTAVHEPQRSATVSA